MIHQYKMNGYNIVLDVYSASIHVTDDLAYDAIHLIDTGLSEEEARAELKKAHPEASAQDLEDTFSDIDELIVKKKLFTTDVYEKAAGYLKKQSTVVKALCLLVAHTCNLNCSYCFASQGKFHGGEGLMTFETAKRAIDYLVENSGSRHNLEVDFFGGEPLVNFDVCKKTVEYARSIEKQHNKISGSR